MCSHSNSELTWGFDEVFHRWVFMCLDQNLGQYVKKLDISKAFFCQSRQYFLCPGARGILSKIKWDCCVACLQDICRADGSNVLLCKSQPFTKSFSLISVSNFANRDGSRKDQFPAGCLESAGLLSSLQWMSFPAGCCIAEFYLNQRKVTIQIPNVWNDLNYQRPQQWIVGTCHLVEKFLE